MPQGYGLQNMVQNFLAVQQAIKDRERQRLQDQLTEAWRRKEFQANEAARYQTERRLATKEAIDPATGELVTKLPNQVNIAGQNISGMVRREPFVGVKPQLPTEVSPGASLVDPRTGKLLMTAPGKTLTPKTAQVKVKTKDGLEVSGNWDEVKDIVDQHGGVAPEKQPGLTPYQKAQIYLDANKAVSGAFVGPLKGASADSLARATIRNVEPPQGMIQQRPQGNDREAVKAQLKAENPDFTDEEIEQAMRDLGY